MPPKRRSAGAQPKSQQATLAFHGASNRVTKPGTRAINAKKNLLGGSTKKEPAPDVVDVVTAEDEVLEHTTGEAAIIQQTVREQEHQDTPEEVEAREITPKQIQTYWKEEESSHSIAPRVHQEDLSVEEKILRRFDLSGQYGPCTGIARLKRWKRAHRLGLEPPTEVLAVLLKEQDEKDKVAVQKSCVDELLSSYAEIDV
ncbi:hypothetical protein DM02DRAFT_612169 [Periconia macrospinosa]|uniref:DNA polymerase delta subunit 4 n=1 Tax=Periconia macrospinosa TaxID=97972 RepID=A0A2V1DYW4_9PLEO|nr:hypothetical protein DM02DRAFT_612169 [Periconia macrospinosa]